MKFTLSGLEKMENLAAIKLQAAFRGRRAKENVASRKKELEKAATKIQAHARRMFVTKNMEEDSAEFIRRQSEAPRMRGKKSLVSHLTQWQDEEGSEPDQDGPG